MDRQIVVYPQNEILFSNKEEQTTGIGENMNEPQKLYVLWKKSKTIGHRPYDSIDIFWKRKNLRTEIRSVILKGCG